MNSSIRTEKDKMLAGQMYLANDPQLVAERLRARERCQALNALPASASDDARRAATDAIFGARTNAYVTAPFFCDYGTNITLGANVYFNFNCVVLDVAPVTIGDNVMFGPAAQVYTATHPLDAAERRSGREFAKPIVIGDDVWIGGGAILCPGVRIGPRSVIGAGSVVTRDLPADVFAAGNPCRVIRSL